jgi:molecular chaperone GrpE
METNQENQELPNDTHNENVEEIKSKHLEEVLYLKAEIDNLLKRHQEEKIKITKYAIEKFATELISTKESLESGLNIENGDFFNLKEGMELTLKNLNSVFDKFGIKELNPINGNFNAEQHQAINTVKNEKPANTIVEVLRKGYILNDRLLQPSLVVVSKGNE